MELPKCYRCGRAATNTAGEHGYWCSWCGQAFNPKDEEQYRKEEADKQKEKQDTLMDILHRPTFTCQNCGRVVQPMNRRGDMFLFRGWRCLSCGRMLCDSCHSPTLAQPCKCGSTQFESIDIRRKRVE
ncbi:hypothetical protein ES703_13087 [subsurface metagenome]